MARTRSRHGLTPAALATCVGHRALEQNLETDRLFTELTSPEGICSGGSVFGRTDALAAIANHPIARGDGPAQPLLGGVDQLDELTDAFLDSPHVVRLTGGDQPLYTTVEMLDLQARTVELFAAGLHTGPHTVSAVAMADAFERHPHLTSEQRHLAIAWCRTGHRYQTAIGRAGAGKTTTVAACADAWTAAGYRVVGAAVKGEATRTLAQATGIDCETVAWYLAHDDPRSLPLDARTILVVDEASTLSDRDLDALMDMAATTGASLRLIGDPAQHGAIAAGGMFRVLCQHHLDHTPELATTHRLQDPDDRAAAEALRDGRIDDAFDHLAKAGHLHIVGDDLTMYRHILARWWDAHRAGLDHPMVDRRNTTRQRLNRLAHLLRAVNGELEGEPIAASGGRSFAVGDRVTARAPNRDLHVADDRQAYVRNGALGTVVAVKAHRRDQSRDSLRIDFDGIGAIDVPRSFFDRHRGPTGRTDVGIDHAYALTSYAVQGSTRDVSTSRVDATATRAETYVDITRGRYANHLYLTATTDPLDGETLPRLPVEPADTAVAERLHRSTGELTAWELAHGDDPQAEPGVAVGI
ncbi:MAG: AAA family ATPase [Microthrixaceae bacterium]